MQRVSGRAGKILIILQARGPLQEAVRSVWVEETSFS